MSCVAYSKHYTNNNNVVDQMNKQEFVQRRQQLMDTVGEGNIALLPTAPEQRRNRDVHYRYRPDSDFYYLTGFPEPEAIAAFIPGREQGQYLLFCRERDPEKETWHGKRAGLEGACAEYGADDAFPITDIEDIIPGLLENRQRLYYPMGYYPDFDAQVMNWVNQLRDKARSGVHPPYEMVALDYVLHETRLYKTEAEIEALQRAADVAAQAHIRAMQACQVGMNEYEIEAELMHSFLQAGAWFSYPPIVAGGHNSCVLHYLDNNTPLQDGDMLLIDAGAELNFYASDITRTFPINGRFSPEQKTIYELVLAAQQAAIAAVKPNNSWIDPHEAAVRTITQGLVDLGLLSGSIETLIEEETYKKFFMHRTGHWLGMDVHDVGDYKIDDDWRPLEPGMVMTVEPGIYIPAQTPDVDEKWWDIGVRIEDDVLVTEDGCRVLSAAVPKTVAEIEALLQQP